MLARMAWLLAFLLSLSQLWVWDIVAPRCICSIQHQAAVTLTVIVVAVKKEPQWEQCTTVWEIQAYKLLATQAPSEEKAERWGCVIGNIGLMQLV